MRIKMPVQEEGNVTEAVQIPLNFPDVLKQYTKAAIRTQPRDLLQWSAAYFRALADGEQPPVKDHVEYLPENRTDGLSIGNLRILHQKFSKNSTVDVKELTRHWEGVCLDVNSLDEVLQLGGFTDEVDWLEFVALTAGQLGKNLIDTMKVICNILTENPDAASPMIPFTTFSQLYQYLVDIDGEITKDQVDKVLDYLESISEGQDGNIGIRNFDNNACPSFQ